MLQPKLVLLRLGILEGLPCQLRGHGRQSTRVLVLGSLQSVQTCATCQRNKARAAAGSTWQTVAVSLDGLYHFFAEDKGW